MCVSCLHVWVQDWGFCYEVSSISRIGDGLASGPPDDSGARFDSGDMEGYKLPGMTEPTALMLLCWFSKDLPCGSRAAGPDQSYSFRSLNQKVGNIFCFVKDIKSFSWRRFPESSGERFVWTWQGSQFHQQLWYQRAPSSQALGGWWNFLKIETILKAPDWYSIVSVGMSRVDDSHCSEDELWEDVFNPPWNFCADNYRLDETTMGGDSGKVKIRRRNSIGKDWSSSSLYLSSPWVQCQKTNNFYTYFVGAPNFIYLTDLLHLTDRVRSISWFKIEALNRYLKINLIR